MLHSHDLPRSDTAAALRLCAGAEKSRQLVNDTLDYIWNHPETGYREWKTHTYLAKIFRDLGYELTEAGDIPGFYTVLDTGRPGPEVLILGEMDSLIVPTHPQCDRETGAVHSCGHAAQCAALVGIAAALKEPGALDGLSGRIRLCAVPAEELIEIEYRLQLREKGVIRYMGGKTEFLHRGYFDGVDLAFMVHTTAGTDYLCKAGMIGCLSKQVIYSGRSAHAGGCPWNGINALYAAQQGLGAINAIRETFREKDYIRVHPIITAGGGAVNAIPERVTLESFVRSGNFAALADANRRVNRALVGAALSLGANVDIQDTPGYAPLRQDPGLFDIAEEAAAALEFPFHRELTPSTGSTDMGDLSQVMPALHPCCPGAGGTSHGSDYYIADAELAGVGSAKWQLMMLHMLLANDAVRARKIVADYVSDFGSVQEYLDYLDTFVCSGDRIRYTDSGAEVTL